MGVEIGTECVKAYRAVPKEKCLLTTLDLQFHLKEFVLLVFLHMCKVMCIQGSLLQECFISKEKEHLNIY